MFFKVQFLLSRSLAASILHHFDIFEHFKDNFIIHLCITALCWMFIHVVANRPAERYFRSAFGIPLHLRCKL